MINPKHVLIIPDGNRRYSRDKNIDLKVVYNNISDFTTNELVKFFLFEKLVEDLSIFAISRNNVLRRKKEDIQPIYEAQIELYTKWLNGDFSKKIRFNFIGDKTLLSNKYQDIIRKLENKTKNIEKPRCNLLVAYDGVWELNNAYLKKTNESETIEDYLLLKNQIDLLIRTGKEKRLSGCPLYQLQYAELIFTDFYYPELTKEKLEKLYKEFKQRQRRYGE